MRDQRQGIKKVLMTADTVGGVWTYSMELAAALEKKGVQVFLATMGAALSHQQLKDTQKIKTMEVFESGFRLEWMQDPWENVRLAGEWLLRLEEYIEPDVVHLNGYSHGKLPFNAPVIIVGHSCVLSWWDAVRRGQAPREWDRYRQEVEDGLLGAKAVAAPSKAMLEALHRHYDFYAPSRVISNGRDASIFTPSVNKGEYIFMAGRLWDEAKNAQALEAIANRLKWPVYAAGPTEHPSGETFSDGAIKTLGTLSSSRLLEWFSRAPIFAAPALYEPFGLTALEAGLSGAALVLGDIPSLREIWDGAAIFVDPRDPLALKDVLERLIDDKEMRDAFGRKARARALKYSPDRMADEYLQMYQGALGDDEQAGEGVSCVL